MARDLMVILRDEPGQLAQVGELMGEVGVNIHGLAALTGDGHGVVHVLVDDDAAPRARDAFKRARIGLADDREVLVIDVEDRPGTLGELARERAEANVNIDFAYPTFGGIKLVIATDDLQSARRALDD